MAGYPTGATGVVHPAWPTCEIRVRSDASMLTDQEQRAGLAAHVRIFNNARVRIGGLNARMKVKVRDIHEAEQLAYEMGQYLLVSEELRMLLLDCGAPFGGQYSVTRIECMFDMQGMFDGGQYVHGEVRARFRARARRAFGRLSKLPNVVQDFVVQLYIPIDV